MLILKDYKFQIAGGVFTVAVAKRFGHSSPIKTNRVYAHAIRSADEMAAEVLDEILTPKLNIKAKRSGKVKIFVASSYML